MFLMANASCSVHGHCYCWCRNFRRAAAAGEELEPAVVHQLLYVLSRGDILSNTLRRLSCSSLFGSDIHQLCSLSASKFWQL